MIISRIQFLNFIRKKKETNVGEDALTSSTRYYLRKFDQYGSASSSFISWNWAAAFFPVSWLLYRRMYLYTFLWMLISAAGSWSFGFSMVSALLPFFLMGALGNAMYFQFVKSKIKQGITSRPPSGWALWLYFVFAPLVSITMLMISHEEKKNFDTLEPSYKLVYIIESREAAKHMKLLDQQFRLYLMDHYKIKKMEV